MKVEYLVPARSGKAFRVKAGAIIEIIDIEGKQVVDFWALNAHDFRESLSPGVTMDCNASVYIAKGESIYTNRYQPMFVIDADDVGRHDLLHPCCRPEMYDFFYSNGEEHPNCFDNIVSALEPFDVGEMNIVYPLNFFMQTTISPTGKISIEEPRSKPGDSIHLRAMMDSIVALAACSVSESDCNGRRCTPVKVIIT